MTAINLTPHPIRVGDSEYPPSGRVLRLAEHDSPAGEIAGHPAIRRTYSLPGMPAPEADTIYLVSAMMLPYCGGRADIFAPDTGSGGVRDNAGRLTGTTRLIAAPEVQR